MTIDTGNASYSPNSLDENVPLAKTVEAGGFATLPSRVDGVMRRVRSASFDDHFSQATLFWNSMSPPEQEHIISAFSFELSKLTRVGLRERVLRDMLSHIDAGLTAAVAANLGLPVPKAATNGKTGSKSNGKAATNGKIYTSPLLSQLNPKTGIVGNITGRKIAILAADGTPAADVESMKDALAAAGATGLVLAARLGSLKGEGGAIAVDHALVTMPSVAFDAVYVPGGTAAAKVLATSGGVRHFLAEAFRHVKAIALDDDAVGVAERAGITSRDDESQGVTVGSADAIGDRFIAAIGLHRAWARTELDAVPA